MIQYKTENKFTQVELPKEFEGKPLRCMWDGGFIIGENTEPQWKLGIDSVKRGNFTYTGLYGEGMRILHRTTVEKNPYSKNEEFRVYDVYDAWTMWNYVRKSCKYIMYATGEESIEVYFGKNTYNWVVYKREVIDGLSVFTIVKEGSSANTGDVVGFILNLYTKWISK